MSQAESSECRDPKAYRSPVPAIFKISFILSALIICAAVCFTFCGRDEPLLTFRSTHQTNRQVPDQPHTIANQATDRSFHEQQVQDLLMLDEQLMQQMREIKQRRKRVPDAQASRHQQTPRAEMLRRQADLLVKELPDGKVVEGTMEWQALEDIKKRLENQRN
jgi:hypothetical protein